MLAKRFLSSRISVAIYCYGTLNGRKIYNNYQITEPGQYQLILENANNEQRIIDFYVRTVLFFMKKACIKNGIERF